MDLWVFAYGSLMWRPGFPFAETVRARLDGYHRAFCIYSVHYRGTPIRPGLVLGLDRGGACEGIAYRVTSADAAAVLAYLRQRELIYGVYCEMRVPVTLETEPRRKVLALTYTAERTHPSYAGRQPLATMASIIRRGRGTAGSNIDYLIKTCREIEARGIRDRHLARLVARAGPAIMMRTGPDALAHHRPQRADKTPAKGKAVRLTRTALARFGYRLRLMR